MADYRAIEAIGQSIVLALRTSYSTDQFDRDLTFQVYVREDFRNPMAAGASLFLYRITVNGTYRSPTGAREPDGRRRLSKLPLDLHYLITMWARDATLQHRIAGWLMRLLEDTPVLPFGLLDAAAPGVFREGETVELVPDELTNEDLFRIWEILIPEKGLELSLPYVVRNVWIESEQATTVGAPVQERRFT